MHSAVNRAQSVFSFFTTVAFVLAGLTSLTVLLYPAHDVTSSVQLKNVQVLKGRPMYYSTKKEDYAQIKFDLDADLTPLFNWNTKQLFVYVIASYSSASPKDRETVPYTESIIWDTIIPAPESAYSLTALREQYWPAKSTKRSTTKKSNTKKPKKADEPGVLRLRNQRAKYQITDITGKMAERENVTLTVGWNVQPWVGALWWSPGTGAVPHTAGGAGRSEAFDFPALKGSTKAATGGSQKA
ncbi:hypothetical protein ASPZODRAFT_129277 [Penicilliopsis zonata CBS 506.65]|uniref:Signal peptidase subunit 3 n=1 Tax=Penicilliopsis zonata CBS 506.65 TaxID=1073090 RepID=A0A1L9SP22_9EURO|nr:hypothetical protein ASPZODRAFT_129277 [Penicilliopsis zonata CBS 506.65]OJJ48940.1 hypothetical protein ASPZODRAFT_129277 [Penicilliopsis zonata CBS 506.65]